MDEKIIEKWPRTELTKWKKKIQYIDEYYFHTEHSKNISKLSIITIVVIYILSFSHFLFLIQLKVRYSNSHLYEYVETIKCLHVILCICNFILNKFTVISERFHEFVLVFLLFFHFFFSHYFLLLNYRELIFSTNH